MCVCVAIAVSLDRAIYSTNFIREPPSALGYFGQSLVDWLECMRQCMNFVYLLEARAQMWGDRLMCVVATTHDGMREPLMDWAAYAYVYCNMGIRTTHELMGLLTNNSVNKFWHYISV